MIAANGVQIQCHVLSAGHTWGSPFCCTDRELDKKSLANCWRVRLSRWFLCSWTCYAACSANDDQWPHEIYYKPSHTCSHLGTTYPMQNNIPYICFLLHILQILWATLFSRGHTNSYFKQNIVGKTSLQSNILDHSWTLWFHRLKFAQNCSCFQN